MGSSRPDPVSLKLLRIAELAGQTPRMVLTTLAHHIDVEFMAEAYRRTRKDGAVGVDGQTAAEFEENLQGNLESLLGRLKSGTYRAPPVRRVHIPKGDGSKTRPIGIPTLEDKVLQRAVTMVLEAIYEQDFLDCSYGFRPGRSAHQALQSLWDGLTRMGGGWVLDADVQSFFDRLDHGHLRCFLDQRVRDGVLRRAIGKWLNAGVMEAGQVTRPKLGTPQGGVISPLLANIYLHEVLDTWFVREVAPRLWGRAFLVRYADDFVIAFEYEGDARRVMSVLPRRLERFGLSLHPDKTRLVDFRCPPPRRGKGRKSETFDLLGFTHYWGRSRKGIPTIKRRTARGRFARTLVRFADWCRRNRHKPVAWQHRKICQALLGHDAYYGITGNSEALWRLRNQVRRIWRKWLDRRSRAARMHWEKFILLLRRYPLPPGRVVHSIYGKQLRLPLRP
ncbi:MAG: group II intron reverse transcriptase/maturase [bacterium]|nr:group II intron reverse transcriptase/maturase [bacterium]